ncbi:hypothetical protein SUDANB171_00957 [Streptomyces sp. enrichment culture]|uniref:hypothetical protein n=1 Tax=Streptomyces xiamenensis TaxID=408015 RepID=UPI0036E33783
MRSQGATPAVIPAQRWRDEGRGGIHPLPVRAGIHLGTDRAGQPVSVPALGATGIRIGVLGESLFGRLFALRLLAAGARVTASTRVPDQWSGVRHAAGDRLEFAEGEGTGDWPAHTPAPPTVEAGPQALISDRRRPPPVACAAGPWRTVLHVTRAVPRHSAFWGGADAVLALDAQFAPMAARVLGEEAGRLTASLAPGQIALFRPAAGSAEVLRPDVSPGESALLTPGAPAARRGG